MNRFIFLLCFIVISVSYFAQGQDYPKGVYMSFDEIKTKEPSFELNLLIEKRSEGDIRMHGGNDYKLLSEDKDVTKSFLKKDIVAYSDGDTLYLNCRHFEAQSWYTKLLYNGDKYLIYKAALSSKRKVFDAQIDNSDLLNLPFGGAIIGGIRGAVLATARCLYVFDKEDNKVIPIYAESLKNLLSIDGELLFQFSVIEENQNDEDIQIKYLKILDEIQ